MGISAKGASTTKTGLDWEQNFQSPPGHSRPLSPGLYCSGGNSWEQLSSRPWASCGVKSGERRPQAPASGRHGNKTWNATVVALFLGTSGLPVLLLQVNVHSKGGTPEENNHSLLPFTIAFPPYQKKKKKKSKLVFRVNRWHNGSENTWKSENFASFSSLWIAAFNSDHAHPHTHACSSWHKLALKIKRQNMWYWKHPIWTYTTVRINSILSFQINIGHQKNSVAHRKIFLSWYCVLCLLLYLDPKIQILKPRCLPREKSYVPFHSHTQITLSTLLSCMLACAHTH